ncbi:MAG: amidohydrolase [Streptosporangiales bacterium]|nr:amidohydrolase [Streptosporangiales bacterium]
MSSMVLRNGRIGVGGARGDVVIDGGIVTAVGPGADVPAGAEVVDLQGATVLPGLWDSHVHSAQWALTSRRLNLADARSAAGAADAAVRAAARADWPGGVVAGYGFRDALWGDAPHKDLLTAGKTAGKPVVLVSADLHSAWLNDAALTRFGHGDHPDGVLREHDCFEVLKSLPAPSPRQLDEWIASDMRAAAARGVVGILDFEFADNVSDWARRASAGPLAVRVRCSVPRDRLDEAIDRGLRTGDALPGAGGLLEAGPVKLFADGSLNTRTAYCADPYPVSGTRGILEIPPDELEQVMRRAAGNGIHPAVHAIGDQANALVLDAFEAIGCPGRIEHAQLLRAGDEKRFARPGLVAGVQPAHCPDDRDAAEVHWPGRTGRAYPYRTLLEAGAVLELGSDAPVAPLDPWDAIASAVFRTDDDREGWHPEQAIGVADALAASSRGRRDVAAGDPADLVVVGGDPESAAPAELRSMPVLGTLLDGRWTFSDPVLM